MKWLTALRGRRQRKQAESRLRERQRLAQEWPELWKQVIGPIVFIEKAAERMTHSRAWDDDSEWTGTAEDPGLFAAHQTHRPIDRAYHPHCPLCRRGDQKRTDH